MQIDTPFKLTLHVFGSNHWQDAMTPEFAEPQNGFDGLCCFGHDTTRSKVCSPRLISVHASLRASNKGVHIEHGEGNQTLKSLNAVFRPFGLTMGVVKLRRSL